MFIRALVDKVDVWDGTGVRTLCDGKSVIKNFRNNITDLLNENKQTSTNKKN